MSAAADELDLSTLRYRVEGINCSASFAYGGLIVVLRPEEGCAADDHRAVDFGTLLVPAYCRHPPIAGSSRLALQRLPRRQLGEHSGCRGSRCRGARVTSLADFVTFAGSHGM